MKIEDINTEGKIRLGEIALEVEQYLREHFKMDDVSKYKDIIAEAAVAILQIEQVLAKERGNIFTALVSMCEAQDVIESSMRARAYQDPTGFFTALGFKKGQG